MKFPETCWTVLAEATLNGDAAGRDALDQLCRNYWQPVAVTIRSRGVSADRVEDLTQDFFLQLMQKSFFKRADPDRGRFRSFMLTSLRLFMADDVKHNKAIKRGGEFQRTEFIEEEHAAKKDDVSFDRAWAENLFDRAIERVASYFVKQRGEKAWAALRNYLPGGDEPLAYPELGVLLGMSQGAAKTYVSRVRQRFREAIRSEVGRTVSAPHEIDEELSHLRKALEGSPGRS